MRTLALDINDANITAYGDSGVHYREPGYALLENERLTTGDAAFARARLQPRDIHARFWSELGVDALPDQRFRHLSAADLVSRQLEQLWASAGADVDQVIIAVPAYMSTDRLGLLLGICSELGVPVAGLVDAAVAATRREYVDAVPVHVDISLHATLLTRLGQPGCAQVEKAATVENSGLVALHDAWIKAIADAFVRQSRFDPLHTAETEQLLFDRLPGWLEQAAASGTVVLDIEHRGLAHTAELDTLSLVGAAAPVYQRIVAQLRALVRAGEAPALQFTDRAARLPGLADMLKARVGGEIFLLEPAATVRGTLARARNVAARDGQVALVRQLPWDQAAVRFEIAPDPAGRGRPTHVLFGDRAAAIDGEPLTLGSRPVAGERWLELAQDMPGVSRRHCVIGVEDGHCVVRDYSRFGTFLNGHRLEGSAVLQAGDTLRIGTPGFELRMIVAELPHGS